MINCIKDFLQGERRYAAGDVVSEHPATEAWLLDSWPAHFERSEETTDGAGDAEGAEGAEGESKDIAQPAADKMIRQAQKRK